MRCRSRRRSGCGRESGDVADLDQAPGCTGGADAVQVHQPGPGRSHELAQLFVGGLLPGVDPFQVCDELGCEASAGLAGHLTWPDLSQQLLGLGGGEILLRPAGDQLQQQGVQLGDLAGVLVTELTAAVGEQPQYVEIGIAHHRT